VPPQVVRNEIKEFAGTRQLFNSGIKLIILDEADAMTNDAQFALRRVIEKYTKNARFCLICNYVSKIIPALQSRCTRFRFAPLSRNQIEGRLLEVAKMEHCTYTDDGIDAILRLSGGDMRRVLNLLQSTAMSAEVVDETSVYLTSGAPLPLDMAKILDILMNQPFSKAYTSIVQLCTSHGYALVDVLQDLTVLVVALDLPNDVMARLLDGMSNVEYRLAIGTDEKIQTASLVGVFVQTRELIVVN
jgi:replication factor C subunit 3/5